MITWISNSQIHLNIINWRNWRFTIIFHQDITLPEQILFNGVSFSSNFPLHHSQHLFVEVCEDWWDSPSPSSPSPLPPRRRYSFVLKNDFDFLRCRVGGCVVSMVRVGYSETWDRRITTVKQRTHTHSLSFGSDTGIDISSSPPSCRISSSCHTTHYRRELFPGVHNV